MRRVAAALDTGPASLYVYVPDREGLLQAMEDRIVAAVELETPDPARWRDQLHALLQRAREHWSITPASPPRPWPSRPGPNRRCCFVENMLGILLAGGLDPQDVAWAADIFALLVTTPPSRPTCATPTPSSRPPSSTRASPASPPERFPLITAHAARLVTGDAEQRFHVAIDFVVDGMLARVAPPRPGDNH